MEGVPQPDPRRDALPELGRSPIEAPAWKALDVVLAASIWIAAYVVTIIVLAPFLRGMDAAQMESNAAIMLGVQLAANAALVLFIFVTATSKSRQPFLAAVRWRWPRASLWVPLAAGGVLAVVVLLMQRVLPMPADPPMKKLLSTPANLYAFGAFGVLVAPFVEELFFRGFLYPVAARRMGQTGAIAFVGALFGLIHLQQYGNTWGPAVVMFTVGATFTAVRAYMGSLAAAVVAHTAYNFAVLVVAVVAMKSGAGVG